MPAAKFIYDFPEKNADLFYASKFPCHDAVIYFENRGKKFLVMSDLEIDRAKREAKVDKILSLPVYAKRAEKKNKSYTIVDVLDEIFSEQRIKKLIVPGSSSFTLVYGLKRKGYKIEAGPQPFYPERFVKTPEEKRVILKTQHLVFQAIGLAENVLSKSQIRGNRIIYRGRPLTSEWLRQMINVFLLERDHIGADTIVACGMQSIDPHEIGSGPLKPHQSIIVDVFPKSMKTLYYADATRTFCKGRVPEALKKLYATVKEGQETGIKKIKAGINGRLVHESIQKLFAAHGYKTGEKGGRKQGFIHSTGHGIGLEVHEEPARIGPRDFTLKKGYIMSVEPGLYYAGIGGVRIEDLVYITTTGCQVLGHYPKKLEIR